MLWACVAACLLGQSDDAWRWPMDLPRQITSSFGEYRSGRFHAAIDLRTGPIGQKVYAAGDGHISRVRCSPYGYGKAIYLTLDNGYTVVYGHLDGFEGALADYVRDAQHSRTSYTVDLYPGDSEFRVSKGDLIARSGQTGVGVPHLHYEWRDAANRPIDPRSVGIDWPDTTAPVVTKILIVGDSPATLLNGSPEPLVLTPAVNAASPHQYTLPLLHATGPFRVGVALYDPANGGSNKLGVQILRTALDGTEIFRVEHTRMSYDTLGDGKVAYDPYFLSEGRFLLAYRWPGNRSLSYGVSTGDGLLDPPAGGGTVTVEAIDFHGNSATVSMAVDRASPPPTVPLTAGTGWGTVDFHAVGNWILCSVTFTTDEGEAPFLVVDGVETAMTTRDGRTWSSGYAPPTTGSAPVSLSVRHPRVAPVTKSVTAFREGVGGSAAWGALSVSVPSDGTYGPLFLEGYALPEAPVAPPISAFGSAYVLWPSDAPLKSSIEISLPMPEGIPDPSAARIYRMGGSYWSPLTSRVAGGRITAETSGLGAFMVMVDDKAPRISAVSPEQGALSATKRPAIQASISDVGSGIDDIRVMCGSQWLLMEYDPEEGKIFWVADTDLPSGEQTIRYRVTDGAGNATEISRTIVVP